MVQSIDDLIASGLVAPERSAELRRVAERFAVAVTDDVEALIDPHDPADPIAAQFVPSAAELEPAADDQPDPIGDERWSPLPGIVHRYPDRVLLKPILVCPVYCRFCFRREQVGKDNGVLAPAALDRALAYIADHPEIWEVIVTGGDPFLLSPRRIAALVARLEAIPHVAVIRFHSRVPVAAPRRVGKPLVAALASDKAVYVVVHANHPRELTTGVRAAVARLVAGGVPVLSQSVLLRGVNDDAAVLEALFRGLVAMRVKPYYLHHPDLAPGTAHFRLDIAEGQRLVAALRGRVSGLCQPTYVLDIPGGYGKVALATSAAMPGERPGDWLVTDGAGRWHRYPPASGGDAWTATRMAAASQAIIVVGGDALALSTARELCLIPGHRVVVLWPGDREFAAAVEAAGAVFVAGPPASQEGLATAGVMDAVSILALSNDDQLNLQAALRARDANPHIRIVLRQFNRTLAPKIEQNLPDCSVLSLAWHSAATYAAAALDPSCFHGLQFPDPDGPLTGFATRVVDEDRIARMTVGKAEAELGVRIIAIDGDHDIAPENTLAAGRRLIVYGRVRQLLDTTPRPPLPPETRAPLMRRLRDALPRAYRRLRRTDRFAATVAASAAALFIAGTWHFHRSFASDWLTAAYFVLSTMTTTGYGDITPGHDPIDILSAMVLMLLGTVFTGIFIAFVASRLTRAQWVRMQGMRPIHRRGHIVVCGCGSIGTGVIDLLLRFDKPLVVVERTPDASLVERARDRGFDLLTGDASRDSALDLCNLAAAHSLVALTNVDTLNLEIALGARARNSNMPVVLRIAEAALAASIARHFQLETTFSVAALAGPVFAGLSRLPGARGRIAFGDQEFAIAEIALRTGLYEMLPRAAIPLAIAGDDGEFTLVRDFTGFQPGTRALLLMPIAKLRDGSENFAEIVKRIAGG